LPSIFPEKAPLVVDPKAGETQIGITEGRRPDQLSAPEEDHSTIPDPGGAESTEIAQGEKIDRVIQTMQESGAHLGSKAGKRKFLRQGVLQTQTPPPFPTPSPTERFVAVTSETPGADSDPANRGIWDNKGDGDWLTNFSLVLEKDIVLRDDIESKRRFEGTMTLLGRKVPFAIAAEDYASNDKLKAAIYQAAGPEAQIHCKVDQLRTAISALSTGRTARQEQTTNFGWTADGTAFLVPSGGITKDGYAAVTDPSGLRVSLEGEELARYLDLRPIPDALELRRVKRHVVRDLLACNDRRVTFCLLGAVGAAALHRFAGQANPFALWLTGITGSGKSFAAKLFANFFGSIPLASGRFATWTATANYLQRQGYFFKDAVYLVDDYKPGAIPANQVTRVLQNYADGTGRGRLKVDATTNTTRPVRGLLVSTGEDIPEHSASTVARSIIVPVPQTAKDLKRGHRCMRECQNYSGIMADFLRWVLAEGEAERHAKRVENLQDWFYRQVAGQQNAERIASNFALLGAGFLAMARYLGDVWPKWKAKAGKFLTQDLVAIRDAMVNEVKDQQGSEIFLTTLGVLLKNRRVWIEDRYTAVTDPSATLIGRIIDLRRPTQRTGYQISTALAIEAVQESLRRQNRPPLGATEKALLDQLRQDGKLLDAEGDPLPAQGTDHATQRVRVGGMRARCFIIDPKELDPDPPPAPTIREREGKPKPVPREPNPG
jgi:hypothetical protein